ncbi:MAG: PBP1A family penicillin-binding protein [Atopobiaceae bacterium]|jgi:1A family penicillin-binding protein|nr:PBP1A family penicillin-binding protein [Atopobiaceae bacterium]MCH4120318.1 PBP1A family penicillin-binding protein [Atopobiaceae bacterium]MCI1389263.1 PBP1A family penicillin-binding protein [Atopobiaceae bacterium]MCI1432326.1 PBP1A family penicillin-binding protein [Atopobiaceae bacterium]MCI1470784.1 PBP1A family penicillin-binding protein [Atopobiaceae bacterium]
MGIRKRRARKQASTHAVRNFFVGLLGILALMGVALAISLYSLVGEWLQDLPDYTSADAYLAAEPTVVYDSQGNEIGSFYLENRQSVDLDAISGYVKEGTVDTEDVRFYKHNGVDPQGIVRAIYSNLTGGAEGASTITQQLVRNTILSDERYDQTLKRKVREAYIAIQMEKTYTKDQILNMYLNTIYYGNGAYGIQVASITYFNKNASDLTLAEAALLVGLPQSPSYYDPFTNPDAAVARRNTVLDRMLTAGDITQEEHDAAVAEPLQLNAGDPTVDNSSTYPYWNDYIKQLLEEDFSSDTIYQGGLKVYTTIDPTCQQAAEEAVSEQLAAIGDDQLQQALVAINPSNGYILAMVGGRDYNTSQYNLATQAQRQPGSSFKAFTLTAAIQEGMSPDVLIDCNSPKQVTSTWRVQNHGNSSYGTISLARATELSSNTGYAQVAVEIGADKIVSAAQSLGIDVSLPSYPSITLGTVGVPVIQMAEAYATLAAGGLHRDPCAITKIEDRNGNVVYEHQDNPTRAVSTSVAYAVTQVLEGVCTNGTASVVSSNKTFDQPVAGKTGTTEDARDLWFVGYTPQVAVAVWTGYIQEAKIYIYGSEGTPARSSVMTFTRYLNKTLTGVARAEFEEAEAPDYKENSTWSFSQGTASDDTDATTEEPQTTTEDTSNATDQGSTNATSPTSPTSPTEPASPTSPTTPTEPTSPTEPTDGDNTGTGA